MDILTELKALSNEQFDAFFITLPLRVQMLIKGKMVDWREVLPQYYKIYKNR